MFFALWGGQGLNAKFLLAGCSAILSWGKKIADTVCVHTCTCVHACKPTWEYLWPLLTTEKDQLRMSDTEVPGSPSALGASLVLHPNVRNPGAPVGPKPIPGPARPCPTQSAPENQAQGDLARATQRAARPVLVPAPRVPGNHYYTPTPHFQGLQTLLPAGLGMMGVPGGPPPPGGPCR